MTIKEAVTRYTETQETIKSVQEIMGILLNADDNSPLHECRISERTMLDAVHFLNAYIYLLREKLEQEFDNK